MDEQAIVIGAGGGIGGALVARLAAGGRYARIHALSRAGTGDDLPGVVRGHIDVTDEASIATALEAIEGPVTLAIVATGILHAGESMPERALRELDGDTLARLFAVNTIGPALAFKHLAPLLPRHGRSVLAALSARVGSITDNRSGGWYGYRASKAALNMIVRSAAIELARSRPEAVCVGLHPGTVDTPLSKPFQERLPAGQLTTPETAAAHLLGVLDGLAPADSGGCFAWDGARIAP